MRIEEAACVGSSAPPDIDGDDAEMAMRNRSLQAGQSGQLLDAGCAPRRPEIEQDITTPELGESNALAAGVVEGDLRNRERARTRGKGRKRGRRNVGRVDSPARHPI